MTENETTYGEGEEMMSVRDVAKYVGRSEETVRRWIWSGKLKARKLGNQLFVARGDLAALTAPRAAEAALAYAAAGSKKLSYYRPVRYNRTAALAALDRVVAFSSRFRGRFATLDAGDMVNESREGH